MKTFIDCHCHAFNLVDVPMYLTLSDKMKMGTIGRLKLAAGALIYLPQIIGNKKLLPNVLERHKEFVLFFERAVERNLEMILTEIHESIEHNHGSQEITEVLVTPLIMDFDELLALEMPEQVGKEPSVREQYRRLKIAIETSTVQQIPNSKVCPFIGFDLRKLLDANKDKLDGFKTFWSESNGLAASKISELESGRLLGIKLYPPIGFNPCPEGGMPLRYKQFFEWCCSEDVPLTVHCQMSSYSAGKEKKNLDANTSPENWTRLLATPGLESLRVNFAHFGGEKGVDDMFEPFRTDKDSWTYMLIKLLKNYPNTFADISAYDYAEDEHRQNLAKIFVEDAEGDFGDGYKLEDKLLWGSDVPMVVSGDAYREDMDKPGKGHYKYYYAGFLKSINEGKNLKKAHKDLIITNMTEKNPLNFLRLSSS